MQVLPIRLIGARSLTAPNTTVAVQCTNLLIVSEISTPLSESRKRRVHSAGERVVLDAFACIGTAVALFSVVKRQHEGFALGFVTTRMFEAAVIVHRVVSIMAVVTLRQTAAEADAASLVAVGRARAPSVMPLSCWGRA